MTIFAKFKTMFLYTVEKDSKIKTLNKHIDPPVFWGSLISIFLVIAFSVYLNSEALAVTTQLRFQFLNSFGWSFVLSVIWIVIFMVKITYRYGDHVIGGPNTKPEFSTLTWISMLFSAGLGTGLLYSGAFEPMSHFLSAPHLQGLPENTRFIKSLEVTFFHWGAPAWFIYSSTGLIFAVTGFSLKKGFQFSELIDSKYKILRITVNILAILSILVGVVSTFALAARQINSGLNLLFPNLINVSVLNSSYVIAFITALATLSVLSGLNKGIKFLSQLNIILVLTLFTFLLFHTHIGHFINLVFEVTGLHINNFISSLTYTGSLGDKKWIGSWTMLYWAWWAAWAPFVGLFIARISKGRTIKEFFLGTVLAPSLICFVWFTLFGLMGFRLHQAQKIDFNTLIADEPYYTLFALLEHTSLPFLASFIAVICVTIFYVTSSDSGSYVVDMIASGGKESPHSYLKIFWSVTEGVLAFILFYFGGVLMIQNLVVLLSLPTLLYICFGIFKIEKELASYSKNH